MVVTKLPVLVLGYNRPALAAQLMSALAEYGPVRLYVSVDGPKGPHEVDKVMAVREVLSQPSWNTTVQSRFLTENHGSGQAVKTAIDWFFSAEPEGVILEDDCIPHIDFFHMAEHILDRYRKMPSVWGMTGSNTAGVDFPHSYGFIRNPLTWGWASWADRWEQHDWEAAKFLKSRQSIGSTLWPSEEHRLAFDRHLLSIATVGYPDAWDYQWAWTVMKNSGLWVVPRHQLIDNVGFGGDSLNSHPQRFRGPEIRPLGPIRDPEEISLDQVAEKRILRKIFGVRRPLWLNHVVNALRQARQITGRR